MVDKNRVSSGQRNLASPSSQMLIAHAGGMTQGHVYTNSLEALMAAQTDAWDMVELDAIRIRDGWAVAHDGTEASHFSASRPFSQMTSAYFRALRIHDSLTPLCVEALQDLSLRKPLLFDCKMSSEEYAAFLNYLEPLRLSVPVTVQAYSPSDVRAAVLRRLPFFYALWRNYEPDVLSARAMQDVGYAVRLGGDLYRGVTLRYWAHPHPAHVSSNLDDVRLPELRDIAGHVALHDAPMEESDRLWAAGYSLFLHSLPNWATRRMGDGVLPDDILANSTQTEYTETFVDYLYLACLHREPSKDERRQWSEAVTRLGPEQSLASFIESDEFRMLHRVSPAFPNGHYHSPVVDPVEAGRYVDRVRSRESLHLGRIDPDANEMLDIWRRNSESVAEAFSSFRRYEYPNGAYPLGMRCFWQRCYPRVAPAELSRSEAASRVPAF